MGNRGRRGVDKPQSKIFSDPPPRIKTKTNGTQLNLQAFHSKGNYRQNEKTAFRMKENICKESNRQGITLQNTQVAYAVCTKKNQTKQSKNGSKI